MQKLVLRRDLPSKELARAKRVHKIYSSLSQFEKFDEAKQKALLAKRLYGLATHAREYSDYWRSALQAFSATDETEIGSLLEQIPPLSRPVVQKRFEDVIARFPGKSRNYTVGFAKTSGSTGAPVRAQHLLEIFRPHQLAAALLDARWHDLDLNKSVGVLTTQQPDAEYMPPSAPFVWYTKDAQGGFSRNLKGDGNRDRSYSEIYEYCASKKPSYLYSGPNIAVGLSRHAMRSGRRDLNIEAYLGFAGAFTEDMRGMIREYLGAKVIERYSAEETGIIARQCPRHDHLHVLTPLCIVEVVDENNRPCAIGEPGRILVTALHSYGMPFLRYDIGDIGVWGERCDCGINLPVLKQIIGRVRHRITNPDGREVTVRFYARDFDSFPEIEEYRFVLHTGSVVVAQIKSKEPNDRLRQAIIKIIQDTLEYPYAVTVNFVETIDWGKSLKKEIFDTSDEAANA